MKLQIKNKFLETSIFYLVFLIFSFLITNSFGLTMPDDGWRHLAMAIYPNEIKSWGDIYPSSLYTDYDPWFMWHHLLRFISNFVTIDNIPVVVNTIIYSLLSLWYYLAFSKFTKLSKIFILIFALGLPILNIRYYYLRPDILSGLFILYFLILKNKILISIISLIYIPFYYIFWFYLGYLAYVKTILKEYKDVLLLVIFSIIGILFYLAYDLDGYIQITQLVLNNDNLLQGHSVGESRPFLIPSNIKNIFGSSILILFLIVFSLLLYFVFKPKDKLFKYAILFIPLFFIQYRFLHLLLPLIYLFSINIIFIIYTKIMNKGIISLVEIFKSFFIEKTYFMNLTKNGIRILTIIFISLFFITKYIENREIYASIEKNLLNMSFLKNKEFKNKKILMSSMNTSSYIATLINPTGKYIPGCSLGWVTYNEKNKKTYFDLLINNDKISINDFFIFLKENNPDYLIIDTSSTSNLSFSKIEIENNGYIFYKIINTKLILRKIQ